MMTLTWNYPNQLGYPAKATGGEFAVIEIPGLGIEASFAMMPASGYEKADPDAGSICDIVIFDCSVIHIFILPFFSL